jgi:hypothetical protein
LVFKKALPCDDGMGSLLSASDFKHGSTIVDQKEHVSSHSVDFVFPTTDDLSDCDDLFKSNEFFSTEESEDETSCPKKRPWNIICQLTEP